MRSGGGRGVSFAAEIDGDRPLDDSGRRERFDESTATDADPASNEASSSLGSTREVFGSFGADADVDRPRHARRRRSLLDRAIAAAASKSKARKEPGDGRRRGGREDIAAFDRRKGAKRAERAPKRESFVGRVLSHNTKSRHEAPKREGSDCKSSPKQRRGSLRFVATSLKYVGRAAPVAIADNEATDRRKPNRSRQSKENYLSSSLVVFDRVASEKYSKRGSLLAAKADRRHRSDPSMARARGGSNGSGRHQVRIKMGGEEGYDEKIASILYSGQ
ncbi:hypothetical protein ACHAXT_005916 [Thalassiosira profunda]